MYTYNYAPEMEKAASKIVGGLLRLIKAHPVKSTLIGTGGLGAGGFTALAAIGAAANKNNPNGVDISSGVKDPFAGSAARQALLDPSSMGNSDFGNIIASYKGNKSSKDLTSAARKALLDPAGAGNKNIIKLLDSSKGGKSSKDLISAARQALLDSSSVNDSEFGKLLDSYKGGTAKKELTSAARKDLLDPGLFKNKSILNSSNGSVSKSVDNVLAKIPAVAKPITVSPAATGAGESTLDKAKNWTTSLIDSGAAKIKNMDSNTKKWLLGGTLGLGGAGLLWALLGRRKKEEEDKDEKKRRIEEELYVN